MLDNNFLGTILLDLMPDGSSELPLIVLDVGFKLCSRHYFIKLSIIQFNAVLAPQNLSTLLFKH